MLRVLEERGVGARRFEMGGLDWGGTRGGAGAQGRAGVGGLFVSGGCEYLGMAGALADQAVKTKMQINAAKAEVAVKLVCDISVGAYWRMLNRLERAAVDDLCGGERSGG